MPRQTSSRVDLRGLLDGRPTQVDRGLEIPVGARPDYGRAGSPPRSVAPYFLGRGGAAVTREVLRDAIVRVASRELAFWQPAGGQPLAETEPNGIARIQRYVNATGLQISVPTDAWSSVFVSYCIRTACQEAGVSPEVLSPARFHITYARAAYARRRRAEAGYFWAYTPQERAPRVGDIVFKNRSGASTVTFASIQADGDNLPSHSDIVTSIAGSRVTVIGGNVSARVRDTHYRLLQNGMLDLAWQNNGSPGIVAVLSLEPRSTLQDVPATPAPNQANAAKRGARGMA